MSRAIPYLYNSDFIVVLLGNLVLYYSKNPDSPVF